ncbi:MAG: patatin-like phospholipase family protein [Muribaculaceae bacterium]|nr:patatin-like phospholipase family protein [Muribaculaceae bacterium]
MSAVSHWWRRAALALTAVCALAATARQSVGLVLSGGGAKGLAHIGVIKALEEYDIPVDFVTGTSMGAIIGSLYAMGYTPEEMMELVTSREFGYWSTGTVDPRLSFYFNKPPESPAMFSFNVGRTDSAAAVPASLISPLPMNFEFMRLYSPSTAACGEDFDRLMVPFRCVASDAAAKHKVVLSHGDLGRCVRASMSFPGVFQPTEVDGKLLYDGGIYDNFPLDVMRSDFAPDIMIGVNVGSTPNGPQTSLLAQLENLITSPERPDIPADELVLLRLHLDRFGLLDFPKAREISEIGYNFAIAHMDSIRARVHSRTTPQARAARRSQFRARVPELRFDSISVSGGRPQQNRYIAYLYERHNGDTFDIKRAREAYYQVVSTGRLADARLIATQPDANSLFHLNARTWLRDQFRASVGGYITSTSNSFLYVGARASSLSFSSMDAGVGAWIGQSYMAAAVDGKFNLHTSLPTAIGAEAVVSRRRYHESAAAFYDNRVPVNVIRKEYFGRLKVSMAAGGSGEIDLFGGGGKQVNHFYRDNSTGTASWGRDRSDYVLWQGGAEFRRSTLNTINFPTEGGAVDARAMVVGGSFKQRAAISGLVAEASSPLWAQLEVKTRNYLSPSRHFSLGFESHTMLSTRKLCRNYNAAITAASSFAPTPASADVFRPAFRANSFVAAGLIPVYRYSDALSARLGCYGFLPLRKICERPDTFQAYYGKWFRNPVFFGEAAIVYKLPFAAITGWCNYAGGTPGGWNVGLSFGIFLTAPKFLQI